jgi:TRAP-type mannitol/chloroaromatic compound transport system substrate-binding protein
MLMAGGEIYTNLERGVIDATEWIGPYHDYLMGFQNVAKYYYYPGWHELGTVLEMLVSKSKFEALPTDLQEIIRTACLRLNRITPVRLDTMNAQYLPKIQASQGVSMRLYPDEVMKTFRANTMETIAELTASDPQSKKIYEAFLDFQKKIVPWMTISEKAFYQNIL